MESFFSAFKKSAADILHDFSETFSVPPGASLYLLVLLALCILVFTFIPLFRVFIPIDDYAMYTYFAEAVSEGANPYAIPEAFRSEVVPTFFRVGFTMPELGVVKQRYADYPPLLMLVNSFFFRLNNLKGLYNLYITLYALAAVLYVAYAVSKKPEGRLPEVNPFLFLIFFALNPLIPWAWFAPIEDKAWFAFFMMLILVLRNRIYWLAAVLALFAAMKGVGIGILFFYLLYQHSNKNLKLNQLALILVIFAAIFALSHLPWFPEWIQGYQWRIARQIHVHHDSFFVPFEERGLYWNRMPQILMFSSFLLLAFLTIRHVLTLPEVLLLPIVFFIIFNTDLSFDRLLVPILALLLLVRFNAIIVISYILGLILMRVEDQTMLYWSLMWGWVIFLLIVIGRQWFMQKTAGSEQQVLVE